MPFLPGAPYSGPCPYGEMSKSIRRIIKTFCCCDDADKVPSAILCENHCCNWNFKIVKNENAFNGNQHTNFPQNIPTNSHSHNIGISTNSHNSGGISTNSHTIGISSTNHNHGIDINSPLDQFEIVPLIPMNIDNFYFSFTNPSLFMLLTLTFFLLLLYFVTKRGGGNLVPNAWQSLVELLYDFVLNLVKEQIGGGNGKQLFFPCILVTFLFLLFCNLQGMIPYSFTVTSHFLITLSLSFSLFIGITIVGFQRHGLHFFSFLLPAGVPLPLAPFLVLLELISYCFRALSLGIRLFANMMAGHSLVKILSGFAWTMLCMNEIFYFLGALGPLFIVLALTGLELGVAILQAYVFTILICIYLNDAINLH